MKNNVDSGKTCLGPYHHGLPGAMVLELETDGDMVKQAIPRIGYEHRCFEKHAENIDYSGLLPLTGRLDFHAPLHGSIAFALAAEKLLGIELPDAVRYIRILLLELNRIASHLFFLGNFSRILSLEVYSAQVLRDSETVLSLLRSLTGDPFSSGLIRIGGITTGMRDEWLKSVTRCMEYLDGRSAYYMNLLLRNPLVISRTAGVGILPAQTAVEFGVTGPCLRACGIPSDVRKEDPYLLYPDLEFSVPVGRGEMGATGDAWDRMYVRFAEVVESIRIIRQITPQCASFTAPDDLYEPLPLPGAHVYFRTESARGELGFYLAGGESMRPSRVKVRTPSFSNLHAMEYLARDILLSDLFVILGSLDICMSEVDR